MVAGGLLGPTSLVACGFASTAYHATDASVCTLPLSKHFTYTLGFAGYGYPTLDLCIGTPHFVTQQFFGRFFGIYEAAYLVTHSGIGFYGDYGTYTALLIDSYQTLVSYYRTHDKHSDI